MTIQYKIWTLALISCLVAASAMADDSEGAYVFISGGEAFMRNACMSPVIPSGTSCVERNVAFRGGLGYQYTSMWGLEASYGQFGYASTGGTATFPAPVGPGNYSWQLKALGIAIQAVATLHMTDDFSVLAKFGVARVEYDEFLGVQASTSPTGSWYYSPVVNDKRNTAALAAGIQYDVTPHGSVRLLVESWGSADIYRIYGSTTKVRLVTGSVGLMYHY